MKSTNELLIKRLDSEFAHNGLNNSNQQNVWIMAAAAIPFAETPKTAPYSPTPCQEAATTGEKKTTTSDEPTWTSVRRHTSSGSCSERPTNAEQATTSTEPTFS